MKLFWKCGRKTKQKLCEKYYVPLVYWKRVYTTLPDIKKKIIHLTSEFEPVNHLAVFLWFAGHEACSYRDFFAPPREQMFKVQIAPNRKSVKNCTTLFANECYFENLCTLVYKLQSCRTQLKCVFIKLARWSNYIRRFHWQHTNSVCKIWRRVFKKKYWELYLQFI